jgi:hypothetical protein
MRRWLIGVAVAGGALVLCVSAVAATKTHYTSGKWAKAPYVSVTVLGGKVKTVQWWLKLDCGYTQSGPTHLSERIKRRAAERSAAAQTYYVGGFLFPACPYGRRPFVVRSKGRHPRRPRPKGCRDGELRVRV